MRYLYLVLLFCSFGLFGQSQGVTNSQTKLRPNQLRWSPTDATLDSVYIIRADTSTGEPGWYLVTLGGGGNADTTLAGDVVGGLNSTFVRKINGVTVENKTPQGREVLQYDGTQWTPDSIDLADLPQMNASRVLGRGSSSAGAVTQLTPSNGVKISGNYIESDLTAGTGINISGTTTLTVSNSAPDQTVTISGATGTYPNFTVTPTSPGGSTTQVQYNNAGSFGALDSFTVSANPDIVGIGVPTPTARLDIQGSGSTSATNALRVRNSAGTALMTVRNDGKFSFGSSGQIYIESFSPSSYYHILGVNGSAGNYTELYRPSGSGRFSIENAGKDISFSTPASAGSYSGADGMVIKGTTSYIGFGINTPLATAHFAKNTTASTPSILLSGTGYSGGTATTTKPTFLIEPTGTTSTGWSTSGTKLGVNAESGFVGNLLDLQVNGLSLFRINPTAGQVNAVNATSNTFVIGSVGYTSGMRVFSSSGSGATYIDGWSDGASKASNYDIVIGSRVNNTGVNLTGSTTAENGTNVQIGFDATSNPRALLSLNSTTRGFRTTRMTTTQRDAVTWVAGDEGMVIFNTTTKKHQGWDGTTWNDFY